MTAPLPRLGSQITRPLGHKGTRGAILVELKRAERLTAKELAVKLGLSLNAVRYHLRELGAESLVEYHRQQRGVGAPVFAYRLSLAAEALFPRRYEAALTEVLDHVVAQEGRAAAVAVLEAHFNALSRRLQAELIGASPAERLAAVARVLSDEGYMAEWEAAECCGTLTEHNCAIRMVAERFPEICAAEVRFLEEVVGGTIERRAHMVAGCSACEYKVRFAVPAAGVAPPEENI